jgi:hypothetical protein
MKSLPIQNLKTTPDYQPCIFSPKYTKDFKIPLYKLYENPDNLRQAEIVPESGESVLLEISLRPKKLLLLLLLLLADL